MSFKEKFLKYLERFKKFTVHDIILMSFMFIADAFGFYFSIAFSVKMSQGKTLFGNSSTTGNVIETEGPTSSDKAVLILYWILTILVFALLIFFIFIKKPNNKKIVKKDIINGKTVIIEEESTNPINDSQMEAKNINETNISQESSEEKSTEQETISSSVEKDKQ